MEWIVEAKSLTDFTDHGRYTIHTKPLIRCRDCKYCVPGYITDNDDFIPPRCGRLRQTMRISGDDYCSFGERRTDAAD